MTTVSFLVGQIIVFPNTFVLYEKLDLDSILKVKAATYYLNWADLNCCTNLPKACNQAVSGVLLFVLWFNVVYLAVMLPGYTVEHISEFYYLASLLRSCTAPDYLGLVSLSQLSGEYKLNINKLPQQDNCTNPYKW